MLLLYLEMALTLNCPLVTDPLVLVGTQYGSVKFNHVDHSLCFSNCYFKKKMSSTVAKCRTPTYTKIKPLAELLILLPFHTVHRGCIYM